MNIDIGVGQRIAELNDFAGRLRAEREVRVAADPSGIRPLRSVRLLLGRRLITVGEALAGMPAGRPSTS